jgi:hypothetical protein
VKKSASVITGQTDLGFKIKNVIEIKKLIFSTQMMTNAQFLSSMSDFQVCFCEIKITAACSVVCLAMTICFNI